MPKKILLTGASGGIGYHTAQLFLQRGDAVAMQAFRHPERLHTFTKRFENAYLYQADITSPPQIEAMVSRIKKEMGTVDILINNAGIAQQKLFTDLTSQDWSSMMETNLYSAFYLTKAVLPDMIHRKCGKIINISSIWGITGASCEVHYSAAKAGLIGMTKALAKELAPSHIQVNSIAPGAIDTDMNASLTGQEQEELKKEIPLGRLGSPQEIASCIAFLASDDADYITGQVISPNGGWAI